VADEEPRLDTPRPVDQALLCKLRLTLEEIKSRIGSQGDVFAGIDRLCKTAGRQFRTLFTAMHGPDPYVRGSGRRSPMPVDVIYTHGLTTDDPLNGTTDVYTATSRSGTAIYFQFPQSCTSHEIPIEPYYYRNALYVFETQSMPGDDEYKTLGRRFVGAVDAWLRWVDQRSAAEAMPSVAASDGPSRARRRRGRPAADFATIQREAALVAEWRRARESGVYKPDFAKDHGIPPKELDRLLDRVAARNSRSDK
jgi:hypothetical protein